jgi:hypothetical protein
MYKLRIERLFRSFNKSEDIIVPERKIKPPILGVPDFPWCPSVSRYSLTPSTYLYDLDILMKRGPKMRVKSKLKMKASTARKVT